MDWKTLCYEVTPTGNFVIYLHTPGVTVKGGKRWAENIPAEYLEVGVMYDNQSEYYDQRTHLRKRNCKVNALPVDFTSQMGINLVRILDIRGQKYKIPTPKIESAPTTDEGIPR
jgi:hypothetical protein